MIGDVLARTGCDPARAVLIGDTRFDLEGARQAGVAFLGAGYGFGRLEELLEPGAPLAKTPAELAGFLFLDAGTA